METQKVARPDSWIYPHRPLAIEFDYGNRLRGLPHELVLEFQVFEPETSIAREGLAEIKQRNLEAHHSIIQAS